MIVFENFSAAGLGMNFFIKPMIRLYVQPHLKRLRVTAAACATSWNGNVKSIGKFLEQTYCENAQLMAWICVQVLVSMSKVVIIVTNDL